jgi:hypothetical protein
VRQKPLGVGSPARRQRRKVRRFRANAVRIDRLAAAERNDELLHSCSERSSFRVIGVARDRIDHRDLFDREVGDDLDLLVVHDQHFLDAHAVTEALAASRAQIIPALISIGWSSDQI